MQRSRVALSYLHSLGKAAVAAALFTGAVTTGAQSTPSVGAYYFENVRISSNKTMSCATCHQPRRWMQDGHERALAGKQVLSRNTPSLLNVRWHGPFFWDGRASSLEEQIASPLYSRVELGATEQTLLDATRECSEVNARWQASGQSIDIFVRRSLADYIRALPVEPSRVETHLLGGPALSPIEQKGLTLFVSKFGCARCHSLPKLTDNQFHDIGLPRRRIILQTTGDRGKPDYYGLTSDQGRSNISDRAEDQFKFRTPSLYNVAHTGPYMHDGSFMTLREVLDFYASRQDLLKGRMMTDADKRALQALFSAMSSPRPPVPIESACRVSNAAVNTAQPVGTGAQQ